MRLKIIFVSMLALVPVMSCTDSAEESAKDTVEGLTPMNFPVMDGSDSTTPLRTILMCRLLGFDYDWVGSFFLQNPDGFKWVVYNPNCSDEESKRIADCMQENNTHQSFINLIDGNVELIIAARGLSRDETEYANNAGVSLMEKPIAKDALTFMVNPENPISGLTTEQIQKIYTGEIKNWKDVGGIDTVMTPFIRNRNSGSQEKFETMVMGGLEIDDFPEWQIGETMVTPYYQIEETTTGIAYTPYYYFSVIAEAHTAKELAVDGVSMTKENIANGTYPYITDVVAAVRADADRSSMAYKLFEFLTTPGGQRIVEESGYVPLAGSQAGAGDAEAGSGAVTFSDGWLRVETAVAPASVIVADMEGRTVFSSVMTSGSIRLPQLEAGVYEVWVMLSAGGVLTAKITVE